MTTRIAITTKDAVLRSISHDEQAWLQTDETESGLDARYASAVESLGAFGLEDWVEENSGAIDAWGTFNGEEWRVLIVDLLESSSESYR